MIFSPLNIVGECKLYIGEYDIAELLLEDCMKAQKEFLGEKHIDSLATAYRLGCYYYDLGECFSVVIVVVSTL